MAALGLLLLGLFVVAQVAANNSASEMGVAYGSGILSRRQALRRVALFGFLGAALLSGAVIRFVGGGLVEEAAFRHDRDVAVILAAACLFDGIANLRATPIATTHAMVCAVLGVGAFYHAVNTAAVKRMVLWWIAVPLAAGLLNYFAGRYLYYPLLGFLGRRLRDPRDLERFLGRALVLAGCYLAFSGGTNGVAKGLGPLAGAGWLDIRSAMLLGAGAIAAGALLWGGGGLVTVGRRITEIGIVRAGLIKLVAATLILACSLAGIPMSVTQTVTSGVIGHALASEGVRRTFQNEHVGRILLFWLATPFLAAVTGYVGAAGAAFFLR